MSETIVGMPATAVESAAVVPPPSPFSEAIEKPSIDIPSAPPVELDALPDVPAPVLLRDQLGDSSPVVPVSETSNAPISQPAPELTPTEPTPVADIVSEPEPAIESDTPVASPDVTAEIDPVIVAESVPAKAADDVLESEETIAPQLETPVSIDEDLPAAIMDAEPADFAETESSVLETPSPVAEILPEPPSIDEDLPEPAPVVEEVEEVAGVAKVEEVEELEEVAEVEEVEEVEEAEAVEVLSEAEEVVGEAMTETVGDSLPEYEGELIAVGESDVKPEELSAEPTETPAEPAALAAESGIDISAPIAMPEIPQLLENEPVSKFDSVQRIAQEAEQASHAAEPPASPTAAVPAAEDPGSGRSYTSPNMSKSDTDGRRAAKLKPLDEGTVLNGRYEIIRKIGGGGMGAVYLANDRNLGGVLRAVKEMVQSYIEAEQQEKAVADFKRESLLLTSLDHQSIPTIFDYFFDDKEGRFYLVMKYISGGDLSGRLRAAPEGKIDEKVVTEWAIQIADVLHYLHTHEPPIVYRDLKPANVMIDGNSGRVMLIDFGIARWVNKEEKGVTAVGTMGYAPPELFSGNVEARSDIYSLGSTMFHLLTGADPQSNPLLIFDFQKNPRPRQINSRLSDQIEQIIMRAVEYSSDARFSSAGEMRDLLREHLRSLDAGLVTYGVKAAPSNRAFSEQMVFCGYCGKQIVATDVFCAFCGAQQPIAQQSISQPVLAPPPTAKLTVIETGELEPSIFKIEKPENLLGRRDPMSNIFPEVDLSKFDPQTKISRRHARVWQDGAAYLVEDLGSSNGTTLIPSGSDSIRLLPHQPRPLNNGDRIRLGDTTLHFTIG